MKRIGIFQFYSEYGVLEEYMEVLLKSMQTIVTRLIIVFNCELKRSEYQKLKQYSNCIYKRENIGYDAGAYKDIFLRESQEQWNHWDEIILFNCTFYGPLFPWEHIFDRMEKEPVDFWGLSRHSGKVRVRKDGAVAPEHLQSYFVVFNRSLIGSSVFRKFWEELEYPADYCSAIENFEWKLTTYFAIEHRFKYTSWLDIQSTERGGKNPYTAEGINPFTHACELIKEYQFPVIKCRIMSLGNYTELKNTLNFVKENTEYDIELIKSHIKHLEEKEGWRPFSIKKLENFINAHECIYIFGHGNYAYEISEFFKYKNWKIDGYVVTVPQHEDEIAFCDFLMKETDGLVVAVGKIALDEVEAMIRKRFYDSQLLFPVF